MLKRQFVKKSLIPASAQAVFAWHERPEAFERLLPPWEKAEILEVTGPISQEGAEMKMRITLWGPIKQFWVARMHDYVAGKQFKDTQIQGPFQHWVHTHRVIPASEQSCWLEDSVEYVAPFGIVGDVFGGWLIRRKLERMFAYRHQVMLQEFQ